MPIVDLKLPNQEEEEQGRRFQVLMFYLDNLKMYISHRYGGPGFTYFEKLLDVQRALPSFSRIQRHKGVNPSELKRRLWLAWGAEVQLRTGYESKAAFLRYSNVWAPVHAYYAMYMLSHALFAAMGLANPPEDHTASLNTASSLIGRGLFPEPWCVLAAGCPPTGDRAFLSLPNEANPDDHVELLSSPEMPLFWPRFCKMLEKTRERRLERRFSGWKKEHARHNMFADEKRSVAERVPPTSMYEFFYRLRIRSNYQDISSYVMAAVSDTWHENFHSSLVTSTSCTCLLLESLVKAHAGKDVLAAASEEFMGSGVIPGVTKFLEVRRDHVLA